MNLIKMGNPASPHPVCGAGGDESVQMDKCVKIILDSYGIVVALVPSLYYGPFLKKNSSS